MWSANDPSDGMMLHTKMDRSRYTVGFRPGRFIAFHPGNLLVSRLVFLLFRCPPFSDGLLDGRTVGRTVVSSLFPCFLHSMFSFIPRSEELGSWDVNYEPVGWQPLGYRRHSLPPANEASRLPTRQRSAERSHRRCRCDEPTMYSCDHTNEQSTNPAFKFDRACSPARGIACKDAGEQAGSDVKRGTAPRADTSAHMLNTKSEFETLTSQRRRSAKNE